MPKKERLGPKDDVEASSVRRRVTGRGIAPSIWQKRRRLEPQSQVYLIYALLMFT
jgi:hypothetical protein